MPKKRKISKLKLNMAFSLVMQIALFVSGILLPRMFLEAYGSKVNGLISSVAQFLSFITLGEFGIGAVIQYNLYKPLAEQDWSGVSQIIAASDRFFKKLLIAIIAYITALAALLPLKTLGDFDYLYTASLVICISFSYVMQYYFGMTYRLLIDADQLTFIRLIPEIISVIVNVLVCSILIHARISVQLVKLVTSVMYSVQPLAVYIYAKVKYPHIDPKTKIVGEPIKQKWNGIAQHFAGVVLKNTDVIVLTLFSTLENVSVYAIYNMIIHGTEVLIESVVNNYMAVFGKLIATNQQKELERRFDLMEAVYHGLIMIVFFCIGKLIVPFVSVYTLGISDANYMVPVFAIVLTLAHWFYCARMPYHILIKSAGAYKDTQVSAIIEAFLNVLISVAVVHWFGLVGVAVGTAAAMLYRSLYYCYYLKGHILNRSYRKVGKAYLSDLVTLILCLIATMKIELSDLTYLAWFIMGIKVFAITAIVAGAVVVAFHYPLLKSFVKSRRHLS